jgi:hypothetical protein
MKPEISIVINTCAGSKNPEILAKRGSFGNSSKRPYGERATKLRQMLERLVPTGAEIIVVGEWETGEGYTYVEFPGPKGDPTDQIPQRHAGAQAAQGDIVVFLNDDHFPEGLEHLPEEMADCDVGAFYRWFRRSDGTAGPLENGWASYVMGHACVMTRAALEALPWSQVPTWEQCDVAHTSMLRAAGLRLKLLEKPVVWDIEMGDLP